MGMLFIIFFFPWCWCNYSCMSCPFCYCILVYIYDIYRYIVLYYMYTVYHIYVHTHTRTYISLWLFLSQPSSEFAKNFVFRPRWNDRDWDPMIGTSNLIRSKATGRIFRWKNLRKICKILQLGQTWGDETHSVIYIGFFNHHLFFFAHPAHGPPANTIGGLHIQEEKSR